MRQSLAKHRDESGFLLLLGRMFVGELDTLRQFLCGGLALASGDAHTGTFHVKLWCQSSS